MFQVVGSSDWWVSLGQCGLQPIRSYPLDRISTRGHEVFFLSARQPQSLPWEFCLNIFDLQVVPTQIVSPRHGLCLPAALKINTGVCFLKIGDARQVFHHAARNGFWQLPKFVLERLATMFGVPKKLSETMMIHQLLMVFFPDESLDNLAEMMNLRGLSPFPDELDKDDLPVEALDDLVPEKDKNDIEDFFLFCLPA